MKAKGYVMENVYWMMKDENDKSMGNDDELFF
jgi:hypothetical protein